MTRRVLTMVLAEFAADPAYDALGPDVVHAVRRAIADSIAVSVAGAGNPAMTAAIAAVGRLGGAGTSRVIGTDLAVDAYSATLLNGMAAHVLDWDDTILPTRAHLSAALLPPMLALGEARAWALADVTPAFAIGFELQSRLNRAVYPSVHLRGWQGTGIVGAIGTAAAIGRLLGSGPAKIAHGMGIGATGAAGLIATFGSMSKALNIGRAGANGLQSALLADAGFTSHADMIGEGQFLEMYDDAPRAGVLTEGLGTRWSILDNGYKPYPCGFVAHAMIDAVRDLRDRREDRGDLVSLHLDVSTESMHLMGNRNPTNGLEAKFSLLYDAAVAWVEGNVTPAAFEQAAVGDPRYRDVMTKTRIIGSDAVRQQEARGVATFSDGSIATVSVENARGTPARPLTDDDLLDKWDTCFGMAGLAPGTLGRRILSGDDVSIAQIMTSITVPPR